MAELPVLGVGLGYRPELCGHLRAEDRRIDFLEVIADPFLEAGPERATELERLRALVPVVPHGLALSIGSAAGLEDSYLDGLARLVERLAAPWFSEHLGFTRAAGLELGHFVPLPFTWEAVEVVRRNLDRARARLGVPLLLENITAPFVLPGAEMTEAEFLRAIVDGGDAGLLLDLTNLHVNCANLGLDVDSFLEAAPLERVAELHIAGVRPGEASRGRPADLADSHDAPVPDAVWALLERVLAVAPVRALVLERDERLGELDEIDADLRRARAIWEQARVAA
jgi:uncharacterized protein (UPF0276 family)